jgi:threonine aldolase
VLVDLRSDTVTAPTPAMRAAMAGADVGDDVYGEDPTVRALEERIADLCGHEAGLFVASGSLGNQLGLRLACPPGDELLCDEGAHVVTYELGAAAVVAGITTRTFPSDAGVPAPQRIESMVRPDGYNSVVTRAVSLEQTHNRAGGTVIPLEVMVSVRAVTSGLHLHVDGARVWNACAAGGFTPAEVGALCDTMSVCLSKGLGAPVGSVLVGSATAMDEARVWRKRLGGGMRQAGILAAAGLYALDHHLERLVDDHRRATRLAAAVGAPTPQTNIVMIPVADAKAYATTAAAHGVLVSAFTPTVVRAVTHLDVDDAAIARAVEVLSAL